MELHELIETIITDIKSGNYPLQKAIERSIHYIEQQKDGGVTYLRMLNLINEGLDVPKQINTAHFRTIIHIAKKNLRQNKAPEAKKNVVTNKNTNTKQNFEYNATPDEEDLI